MESLIRDFKPADGEAAAMIKNHYILHTTANFGEEAMTAADFAAGIAAARERHGRALVAEVDGKILGFAAADRFRTHSSNRLAELSIYLDPGATGNGVGRELLCELIRLLRQDGFYAGLIAVITADNLASCRFHRAAGFVDAGYWSKAAFKFDRWHDVAVLEYLF